MSEAAKPAEQARELEQQRIAALEKGRLKRMRTGDDDAVDDSFDDVTAPQGGFAARRHKQRKALSAAKTAAGPSGASSLVLAGLSSGTDLSDLHAESQHKCTEYGREHMILSWLA